MKKWKKLVTGLLAMAMILTTGMTAFADTTDENGTDANKVTTDITINADQDGNVAPDGSTYQAYRLLDATVAEGENVTDDDKVAYTLNDTYTAILQEVTGKIKQQDIIAAILGYDDVQIRNFADAVYGLITQDTEMKPDATTITNQFHSVPQGYYLIVETSTANSTYSLVMLGTAGVGTYNIATKEEVPTLEKHVKEKNDTTGEETAWQDAADYDIGDKVPFRLTGTLPSIYDNYKTYRYVFHDTLSSGFTFDKSSVTVKVISVINGLTTENTISPTEYDVVTNGLVTQEDQTHLDDGCSFEVRFANLKELKDVTITKDSKIVVEYTAELNDKAVVVGQRNNEKNGNPNIAKLEYSNNPYYNGEGTETTSMTPEDKAIVFTYELDVLKVDGNGSKLKGAGFTLYKLVPTADGSGFEYALVKEATKGGDITTFVFEGLDSGKYKIVETTVPNGYNKAEDIEFEITASYDAVGEDPKLSDVVVTHTNKTEENEAQIFTVALDGLIETKIKNVGGILLPSTGGIGTTIFYIVGAVVMVGAAFFLVKNRQPKK